MTELIHSSNLDSTSCDASNVPLDLISEITEVKPTGYQSSSDDETFDEDDEEVTPTIMPLPITRESSKKIQNSSEDLDILSLIAGSKNGDDFIPQIITPENSRSRRASGTSCTFIPQSKVDEFPVDDGLDDFYVPIVKNVTPLGTRRSSLSGFSTGIFKNLKKLTF